MKKSTIIIFLSILLLNFGISGCMEEELVELDSDGDGYNNDIDVFPDDDEEWIDNDNDGVGDNSDGFPNNNNLTEKIVLMDDQITIFIKDRDRGINRYNLQSKNNPFVIDNDIKYLLLESDFEYSSNGEILDEEIVLKDNEHILLECINPKEIIRYEYEDLQNNTIMIEINDENSGDWFFSFVSLNLNYDVLIGYNIYIGK